MLEQEPHNIYGVVKGYVLSIRYALPLLCAVSKVISVNLEVIKQILVKNEQTDQLTGYRDKLKYSSGSLMTCIEQLGSMFRALGMHCYFYEQYIKKSQQIRRKVRKSWSKTNRQTNLVLIEIN